jgi:glycosyltransferase involved in cell wall biosynthesis
MQGGGAERVAALLCNHWVASGYDVILMPTFSGRGECLYPLDSRVQLDYLADRVKSRRRSVVNQVRRFLALRNAIRDLAPDIVVSFLPHVNVAAVLAASGLNARNIVSERSYPPAMPVGAVLECMRRVAYARATGVVVQTERTLEWLARTCPGARGHIVANPAIYPLADGEPVLGPGNVVGANSRLVLAAGRLGKEKGFDRLIGAFRPLAERYAEWDLVILGEGPERAPLERLRADLGLVGRVHLPGRVGNVADWYARSAFYVLSSRFEGFPNSLLEAMAHGLPAVSFDCDAGPRDIIRPNVDGFLVPPDAGERGLSEAMDTMMEDEEKRRTMTKAATEVRARFSIERIAAEWERVLGWEETPDV